MWYNTPEPDTHGMNVFRLGRIMSITGNAEPNIVDLAPTAPLEAATETVQGWQHEQSATNAYATEVGRIHRVKSYNILPVTAALQLAVFPYWRHVSDDAHDPAKRADEPAFCQFQWDPQSLVAPNAFATGYYYFWLSTFEPEMAGWVCRGLADIPDEIANSRALAVVPAHRIPDVIRLFPAGDAAPPSGHTRVVWREWLATYNAPHWTQELVIASRANSIRYYMLDSASNAQPIRIVGADHAHPTPFGTWGYTFRMFRPSNTQRTKFSDYDEAMAIVRNAPLHTSAPSEELRIGKREAGSYVPRYWALHNRPADVPLPPDPILTRYPGGVSALLPLEALEYVSGVLARHPQAFSQPARPWPTPGAIEPGTRPPAPSPGRPQPSQRPTEAPTAAAAQQEAPRSPPTAAPGAGRHRRRRISTPAPPTEAARRDPTDFSTFFNNRRNLNFNDLFGDAVIHLLHGLPPECPDPNWGSRRSLQQALFSIAGNQPSADGPSRPSNMPIIERLAALLPHAARVDSAMAGQFGLLLLGLISHHNLDGLQTADIGPPPGPPGGAGAEHGRGPEVPADPGPRQQTPQEPPPTQGHNDHKRQRTDGGPQESEHSSQSAFEAVLAPPKSTAPAPTRATSAAAEATKSTPSPEAATSIRATAT